MYQKIYSCSWNHGASQQAGGERLHYSKKPGAVAEKLQGLGSGSLGPEHGRERLPRISQWRWLVPGSGLCGGGQHPAGNEGVPECCRSMHCLWASQQQSSKPASLVTVPKQKKQKETGKTHRSSSIPGQIPAAWPVQQPARKEESAIFYNTS